MRQRGCGTGAQSGKWRSGERHGILVWDCGTQRVTYVTQSVQALRGVPVSHPVQ